MMRFWLGAAASLLVVLGALVLEGGNGLALLGASAFLVVWFVPFFTSAAIWGYRAWAQAWGAAFHPVDEAVARRSKRLWAFNEFAFYLAGALALVLGLILILSNPRWDQATPGLLERTFAAALVAPLYGFFFGYLARILGARVDRESQR